MNRSASGPADRLAHRLLLLILVLLVTTLIGTGMAMVRLAPVYRVTVIERCHALLTAIVADPGRLILLFPLVVFLFVGVRLWLAIGCQLRTTQAFLRALGPFDVPSGRLARIVDRSGLTGRVDCVADSLPLAFCYRWWRPRICVSCGLVEILDDEELLVVLEHEGHHVLRRDALRLLIARAAADALSFIPGLAEIAWHYRTATEMAADWAAAERAGSRLPLASAVVKLAQCQQAYLPARASISPISPLMIRVDSLLESSPRLPRVSLRAKLGVVLGLALVLTSSFASVAVGQQAQYPIDPCVSEVHAQLSQASR